MHVYVKRSRNGFVYNYREKNSSGPEIFGFHFSSGHRKLRPGVERASNVGLALGFTSLWVAGSYFQNHFCRKEAESYQGEEVGVAILEAGPIGLGVGAGHREDMPRSRGLVRVGRDPQRVAEKVPGAQISGAWASIMAESRVTTSTG